MKKIYSLILILLIVFGFSACGAKSQVMFFPDMVKYRLFRSDSTNKFSFNMNVISSKTNPKIEFVSAEGVNTEYMSVSFTDDTFESIKERKIDNSYVILLGVHCTVVSEYTKIDSMKLRVDGKETVIKFSTPIENNFISYDEHCLAQRNMPFYIFPQSFVGNNETDYTFSVEALKDTEVKSFSFNEFLSFQNATVYINNALVGTIPDAFPLEIKNGDILTVKGKIKAITNDITTKENFYLNLCVDCKYDGRSMIEYYPLAATFIGNIADAKDFVEFVDIKNDNNC